MLAARQFAGLSLTQIAQIVTIYQLAIVREAINATTAMVEEQGLTPNPYGTVASTALVGFTPDGRRIEGLFSQAQSVSQYEQMMVNTLRGSARTATSVAITNERSVDGFMRIMVPPTCQRCAILAGKWFRYGADFDRHVNCDCTQVPCPSGDHKQMFVDFGSYSNPYKAYEEGQIMRSRTYINADGSEVTRVVNDFTKAQMNALDDKADMSQIVNVHNQRDPRNGFTGIDAAQVFPGRTGLLRVTREGTTIRGVAGKRMGNMVKSDLERYQRSASYRLTPWSIYKVAIDREDAIKLLKAYGYIF